MDKDCLSAQERGQEMKVQYDNEVDAVYIKLGNQKPDGVVELAEGVNLDTTGGDKIVGIEILNASKKMDIKAILTYELALDNRLVNRRKVEPERQRSAPTAGWPMYSTRRPEFLAAVNCFLSDVIKRSALHSRAHAT